MKRKSPAPCGHEIPLFRTTDGRDLPIMGRRVAHVAPTVWCNMGDGWVHLTDEEYESIKAEHGGHA